MASVCSALAQKDPRGKINRTQSVTAGEQNNQYSCERFLHARCDRYTVSVCFLPYRNYTDRTDSKINPILICTIFTPFCGRIGAAIPRCFVLERCMYSVKIHASRKNMHQCDVDCENATTNTALIQTLYITPNR